MGKQWTSKAQELAKEMGLKLDRPIYTGSDQFVKTTPQDAVSASLAFEQISNTGANCGQDPANIPSDDKK